MASLVRTGSGWHLDRGGEAMLVLGGELHNSSATDREFLRDSLAHAARGGIDVVLAPIAWEDVEREEGVFDLACVDVLVEECATAGVAVIPLWFGAWKNGRSTYAPGWVLDDHSRFPWAEGTVSHVPTLSLFGSQLLEFEQRAYLAVVERLAQLSGAGAEVLAIQIDNEVGLLGDSRDRSAAALAAWTAAVPDALVSALADPTADGELAADWTGDASTWSAAFGETLSTDAAFMAWHYAAHIEELSRAGKELLPVPTLVNAWLDAAGAQTGGYAGGDAPGGYPSGGPLPQVALAWRTAAPSIDILSPDIYLGDDHDIMARFSRDGAPLFIPETHNGRVAAARAFLAIGRFGAVGLTPFGIDQASDQALENLSWAFARLRALTPWIVDARTRGAITGFILDERARSTSWTHDGVRYRVSFTGSTDPADTGYGLLMIAEDGRVVAAGEGFLVTAFDVATGAPLYVRDTEEGHVLDGTWRRVRGLNGDETRSGEALVLPLVFRAADAPVYGERRTTGIRRVRFVR